MPTPTDGGFLCSECGGVFAASKGLTVGTAKVCVHCATKSKPSTPTISSDTPLVGDGFQLNGLRLTGVKVIAAQDIGKLINPIWLQDHLNEYMAKTSVKIHDKGFAQCALSINTFIADTGLLSGAKYGYFVQWTVQEVCFQLREGAAKPIRRVIADVWSSGSMGTMYKESADGVLRRASEALAERFCKAYLLVNAHENPNTPKT